MRSITSGAAGSYKLTLLAGAAAFAVTAPDRRFGSGC